MYILNMPINVFGNSSNNSEQKKLKITSSGVNFVNINANKRVW